MGDFQASPEFDILTTSVTGGENEVASWTNYWLVSAVSCHNLEVKFIMFTNFLLVCILFSIMWSRGWFIWRRLPAFTSVSLACLKSVSSICIHLWSGCRLSIRRPIIVFSTSLKDEKAGCGTKIQTISPRASSLTHNANGHLLIQLLQNNSLFLKKFLFYSSKNEMISEHILFRINTMLINAPS
jgi:hypothetical protein